MQAEDNWLTQPPDPGTCPLCSKPLTNSGITQSQHTMVTCLSCGFSAPFIQRRQRKDLAPEGKAANALASRLSAGSSVWIDPAVSAFLGGQIVDAGNSAWGTGDANSQHASPLPPSHKPQKQQAGPITPIPPAASAPQYPNNVKVRPKYRRSQLEPGQDADITRTPTLPPPVMWQYESPDFEAESSLPALSLVVDTPTRPETTSSPKTTRQLPHLDELDTALAKRIRPLSPIDEIDTAPPVRKHKSTNIDEIDTLPPSRLPLSAPGALIPAPSLPASRSAAGTGRAGQKGPGSQAMLDDPASWTAGGAAGSAYARRIAERSKNKPRKPQHPFNALDHLRWWLLHPGRIEFILWLGGTILLVCISFGLLFATAVSFSWITPLIQTGARSSALLNSSSSGRTSTGTSTTTVHSSGMTLILLSTGLLVPGKPIHLHGLGCTPHGNVTFTDEKNRPLFDENSQLNFVTADKSGTFAVTLSDSSWNAGHHQIVVRDDNSNHVARLSVVLAIAQFGKHGVPPTPVVSQPVPLATPTSSNGSGGVPTPVNATPASTPTAVVTPKPSPTSTPPAPTPTTVGVTPTPTPITSPTAGITPTLNTPTPAMNTPTANTPTPAPSIPIATTSPSTGSNAAQFMAASVENAPLYSDAHLDAWLWLLIAGYAISMLMLGIAGMLRRHRH